MQSHMIWSCWRTENSVKWCRSCKCLQWYPFGENIIVQSAKMPTVCGSTWTRRRRTRILLMDVAKEKLGRVHGSILTFLLTSPVASDNFDFTSQNQFSTSQNIQAWSCIFFLYQGGSWGRVDIFPMKNPTNLGFSSQTVQNIAPSRQATYGKSVFHEGKNLRFGGGSLPSSLAFLSLSLSAGVFFLFSSLFLLPPAANFVPRVLWVFGQRVGARRDSGEFEQI